MAELINITRDDGRSVDQAERDRLPDWQTAAGSAPRNQHRSLDWRVWLAIVILSFIFIAYFAVRFTQYLADVSYQTSWLDVWLIAAFKVALFLGPVALMAVLVYWLYQKSATARLARLPNNMPVARRHIEQDMWQEVAVGSMGAHYAVQDTWAKHSGLRSLNQLDLSSTRPQGKEQLIAQAPTLPDLEDLPPTLEEALLSMPRVVQYAALREHQPTRWSVPLGLDHSGDERWVDVRSQMLHAGIWGTTGTGKENLLQGWFVRLAQSNDADSYQLFVLDGKGHWLQPKFAELAHMWHPPVGGVGETGERALRAGLQALQAEMKRRGELVFGANCETDEQYEAVTGQRLPLLHVFISDVMSSVAGEIERTLIDLVSKARALGIRVVVSMQTPTGKEMAWRTNLSTVLCGSPRRKPGCAGARYSECQ